MSPINKNKLNLLRVKLDMLDSELLKLIKKRSNLVNDVLKVKVHKKEILKENKIIYCVEVIFFLQTFHVSLCQDYISLQII